MSKRLVWLVVVIVILLLGAFAATRRGRAPRETRFDPRAAASVRFQEARGEGRDLSAGPCLGLIGPDWVADIVHDPRQPVDDDPANQCAEYRSGEATRFVELTPDGTVLRIK